MSTKTFIARIPGSTGYFTRSSATMSYTHAVIVGTKDNCDPLSWHLTEAAARQAASSTRYSNANVVPVEARPGGKAKVERQLDRELAEKATEAPAKEAAPAKATAPAKKAAPAKATAPAKKTAGTRAIPAEAANSARQAWIDANGMGSYRSQYNGGWDSATAGAGEKKATSGTASVAWMDGYTDRKANPGKPGIAAKWDALRSGKAPVAKA